MANDFIVKSNQRRENYRVYLSARDLRGVQNVNISYQNNAVPFKFMGMADTTPILVPNGPTRGEITVESILIDDDSSIPNTLTGNRGIDGWILKTHPSGTIFNETDNISFASGYLTSYQLRCSIGDFPTTTFTMAVFGNLGPLTTGDMTNVTGLIYNANNNGYRPSFGVASPGSLQLELGNFRTNRVLAMDLQIVANRQAIYPMGSRRPSRVELSYPVEVTFNVQYAVNDYQMTQLYAFPKNQKTENISMTLNNHNNNFQIMYLGYSGMTLVSETFSAPVQGQVTVSATYKRYY